MRKKIAAIALTATLASTGAALAAPGLASAQDSSSATATATSGDRTAARVTAIEAALAGLVTAGTITQAQADEVATTLSTADIGGGRGGARVGRVSPETTAEILGITVDQLKTARAAGQTLAQIAQAEGVSRTDLIDQLVAAATTELAEAVTAGRITQAQADGASAMLQARITEKVDEVRTGRGDRGRDGDATNATPAPSATS